MRTSACTALILADGFFQKRERSKVPNSRQRLNKRDTELNKNIEVTHMHLNDKTIAGIRLKNKNCFSVQFHPEASAGPHDSSYLFDEFIQMINNKNE